MLPNLRLSGPSGPHLDGLGQFSMNAVSLANTGLASSSARLVQAASASPNASAWGALNKTLADFVKDDPWPTNNHTGSFGHATSQPMPWAAAVKAPAEHHQHHHHHHHQQSNSGLSLANHLHNQANASTSQDCNNQHSTIGSWSALDSGSSSRFGGWNSDNASKTDGAFDDGTAIWGNPSTKKTGVDWTDKIESLNNASQKNVNSSISALPSTSDKHRAPKAEPTISSINGTEAWGAIINSSSNTNNNSAAAAAVAASSSSSSSPTTNSSTSTTNGSLSNRAHQQKSILNEVSCNTYGTKLMPTGEMIKTSDNKMTSWAETSSLQAAQAATVTNGNSSPPNNTPSALWNNLSLGTSASNNKSPHQQHQQQKSSDWLSSLSSSSQGVSSIYSGSQNNTAAAVARFDDLRKQLESTSIFDSVPSMNPKNAASNKNLFLDQHQLHMTVGGLGSIGSNVIGGSSGNGGGSDSINDLKQSMSANFTNDLANSPTRQHHISSAIGNNQQQQQSQQMDPGAYSATAPSRDLLKQMVHQIQLAVQAGHLNAHILNQPMSTPTLQLVYQLLQQIKTLHQLQEIQQRSGLKTDIGSPNNLDIQINRIKQNISLLQKAISQQQAALTKNETISEQQSLKQQQQGDDTSSSSSSSSSSYAGISKLSTTMKVPPNNVSTIINNINIDSFRRSSLIDSLKNTSDSLRSAQATFDANAAIDKSVSSYIQAAVAAAASADNSLLGSTNGSNPTKATAQSSDFSKVQSFTTNNSNNISQLQSKGLLRAHSSASTSSAWSAFSSGDNYSDSQQGWSSQSRISSNNISQDDMFSGLYWGDLAATTAALQLNPDNDHPSKQQHQQQQPQRRQQQVGAPSDSIGASYSSSGVAGSTVPASATTTTVGGRPAPPPGLYYNFFF